MDHEMLAMAEKAALLLQPEMGKTSRSCPHWLTSGRFTARAIAAAEIRFHNTAGLVFTYDQTTSKTTVIVGQDPKQLPLDIMFRLEKARHAANRLRIALLNRRWLGNLPWRRLFRKLGRDSQAWDGVATLASRAEFSGHETLTLAIDCLSASTAMKALFDPIGIRNARYI